MEDSNDGAVLRFHNSPCGDDLEISDLMVTNPLDVDCAVGCVDHTNVFASNAAIGSSVNEGTKLTRTVFTNRVSCVSGVDLMEIEACEEVFGFVFNGLQIFSKAVCVITRVIKFIV